MSEVTNSTEQTTETSKADDQMVTTRVMYLLLRKDLETNLKWPIGALCTQASHSATAICWIHRNDPDVMAYFNDLEHMHKVTLSVESEERLKEMAQRLEAANVQHHVWIEDGIPTCIAIKPQCRSQLKSLLGRLPLYK
ncbi:Aminoacyl-tRNA hydrolase [Aphelenchoides besseyi]|nr:Aminoacyl-tRNA hydrolase [Aphelenchoides besseyi]KAI6210988.1 Aminoacyl-tRNA hydrolase [Aphelenchoides besseyi]